MTATLFIGTHENTLPMVSADLELLYNEVAPSLAERIGGDFIEVAEVDLLQESLFLSFLDTNDFNHAYQLIMKACEKHQSLQKYKNRLEQSFQSDPRFS